MVSEQGWGGGRIALLGYRHPSMIKDENGREEEQVAGGEGRREEYGSRRGGEEGGVVQDERRKGGEAIKVQWGKRWKEEKHDKDSS
eukprot:768284-Hanusia_phi.AAC.2